MLLKTDSQNLLDWEDDRRRQSSIRLTNHFHGIILFKFLVLINIHSFVFSTYKIKSHFLVLVTFSLSILGTKNVDVNF